MANELQLNYSSGSSSVQAYDGQPRQSIGGIITSTAVPQQLLALFGKLSLKMLSEGSEDYRMVYLKNNALSGVYSTGSITVANNTLVDDDIITIGGEALTEGVNFLKGTTANITAKAIKDAIEANPTTNALVSVIQTSGTLALTAKTVGVAGDAITLTYTDGGGGTAITLSGATLLGGVDGVDISNLKLYSDEVVAAPVLNPDDFGTKAVISIDDNSLIGGDSILIDGTTLVEGVDFNAGGTANDTAIAIKAAIDGITALTDILTSLVVGDTVEITALTKAEKSSGNILVEYTDSGSGVAVSITGYLDKYAIVSLEIGDKWVVNAGSLGGFFVAPPDPFEDKSQNTAEGKKGIWDGTAWTFSFSAFATYSFGFVSPVDIDFNGTTLVNSYVVPTEEVFEVPSGITFIKAVGYDNQITIGTGNLIAQENLGMWIKREVPKFRIQPYDLEIDEGGIVEDEVIPFIFDYDTP